MTEPTTKEKIAAYWALKLRTEVATDLERQSFSAWVNESDDHRLIFEKSQRILDMTNRAQDFVDEDVLDAEFSAAAEQPALGANWRRPLPLIAASLAIALVSVAVLLWSNLSGPIVLATARGEKVEFNLSDGSRAILNTASRLKVDVSKTQRRVAIEQGEAFFDVTKDAARPFVVSANGVEIVVVGTKFNVRTDVDVTTVSVISGKVQVNLRSNATADAAEIGKESVSLRPGDQLIYDAPAGAVEILPFDARTVEAWLSGNAIYDGQPLEYVVADLNRYFPKRLELGDPSLNEIPISGTFDLTNAAATIEGLTVALSLQQVQTASGAIRLMPEDQQFIKQRE